ncbi:hypothetical protein C7N43_00245 [Sphingobacteriales bacterium UPWRP_1]|nr:hypothetical protein BVG80_15175 [Sphingobacteriales bacterium TSM_CSM]PSJ79091.1 hypothetical protein C7N43_00245 [Sphingobacteriales bacterium UPWRP_1]
MVGYAAVPFCAHRQLLSLQKRHVQLKKAKKNVPKHIQTNILFTLQPLFLFIFYSNHNKL